MAAAVDVVTLGVACADVMARPFRALPEQGKMTLVPHIEMHLGGLAGVTATVLCRLGARAAVITSVGRDGFGDFITGYMASTGVNLDLVHVDADRGTSVTLVLISDEGERSFLYHVGAIDGLSEECVDLKDVQNAKVLHWGGPGTTPRLDGEPIGRIMADAKAAGLTTSMDTACPGDDVWFPRIEHALPHLDIVMSSLEEARKYTGQETPDEIAAFYRSFGVETVLVKLGSGGVYATNSSESHRVAAHDVQVLDTTGAGDAACAGFLYGHVNGWTLRDCARLANAVGGLTAQVMGGAEGIRSLDEALAFMEQE